MSVFIYDYKLEAFMHLIPILCVSLMVVSNYMHFFFTSSSQNYHSFMINLTFDAHFKRK